MLTTEHVYNFQRYFAFFCGAFFSSGFTISYKTERKGKKISMNYFLFLSIAKYNFIPVKTEDALYEFHLPLQENNEN